MKRHLSHSEFRVLKTEAEILSHLNHENIVKFKNVRETDRQVLIAMELVHGGRYVKINH